MGFHINSSYSVRPKTSSLVRLQYGAGSDGEEEDGEPGAVAEPLAPAQLPQSIVIKPTPRFGSITLAANAPAAAALAAAVSGGAPGAPTAGSVAGDPRAAVVGTASTGGSAGGAASESGDGDGASNKWTVAPFPTRFLWGSLPPADGSEGAPGTSPATSPDAAAPLTPAPPAGPAPALAARADGVLTAGQRGRMRRMSAADVSMPPGGVYRARTPGVTASTDGTGPLVHHAGSGPLSPHMPPALGAAVGISASGEASAGGPSNSSRPDVSVRNGRLRSSIVMQPPAATDEGTAAPAADPSRGGRLSSASGAKDPQPPPSPSPATMAAARERAPAPPAAARGFRDPAGYRSNMRTSGSNVDAAFISESEALVVARSGASSSMQHPHQNQQGCGQPRLRSALHDSSGGALRPTPISMPQYAGTGTSTAGAGGAQSATVSPTGGAVPTGTGVSVAGLSASPSMLDMVNRVASTSGGAGATSDPNALSLLSRVTRVQPRAPPPQEWKVDPRELAAEAVATMDALAGANGAGSGLSHGVHGYVPARGNTRVATGDGAGGGGVLLPVAVRPMSPGTEGSSFTGARTAPCLVPHFEEGDGAQAPGAPPRQLPVLSGNRATAQPSAHGGGTVTITTTVGRSGVRSSNQRGGEERSSAQAPQSLAAGGAMLRPPMSPQRARRPSLLVLGPGASQPHALPSGRGRPAAGQGAALGSTTSSFTTGHQETAEMRRMRLMALGEKERPTSPTPGAPDGDGAAPLATGAAGGSTAAAAAAAPAMQAAAVPTGRLPGLAAKGKSEVRIALPPQEQQQQQQKGGAAEGKGVSGEEHESIMMRMKKALSFLRRGD